MHVHGLYSSYFARGFFDDMGNWIPGWLAPYVHHADELLESIQAAVSQVGIAGQVPAGDIRTALLQGAHGQLGAVLRSFQVLMAEGPVLATPEPVPHHGKGIEPVPGFHGVEMITSAWRAGAFAQVLGILLNGVERANADVRKPLMDSLVGLVGWFDDDYCGTPPRRHWPWMAMLVAAHLVERCEVVKVPEVRSLGLGLASKIAGRASKVTAEIAG